MKIAYDIDYKISKDDFRESYISQALMNSKSNGTEYQKSFQEIRQILDKYEGNMKGKKIIGKEDSTGFSKSDLITLDTNIQIIQDKDPILSNGNFSFFRNGKLSDIGEGKFVKKVFSEFINTERKQAMKGNLMLLK
jgi:hypothetical protein